MKRVSVPSNRCRLPQWARLDAVRSAEEGCRLLTVCGFFALHIVVYIIYSLSVAIVPRRTNFRLNIWWHMTQRIQRYALQKCVLIIPHVFAHPYGYVCHACVFMQMVMKYRPQGAEGIAAASKYTPVDNMDAKHSAPDAAPQPTPARPHRKWLRAKEAILYSYNPQINIKINVNKRANKYYFVFIHHVSVCVCVRTSAGCWLCVCASAQSNRNSGRKQWAERICFL